MKTVILLFTSSILMLTLVSCTENNSSSNTENTGTQTTEPADSPTPSEDYIALGKEIAQGTFKALSGKLKSQIIEGGVEQALPFCNNKAIPLTDSLSAVYNAKIERVAVNYRNPKNKALDYDSNVYMEYEGQLSDGKMVKPKLHTTESGQTVFYAPIILKGQCVVCHGEPITEITESTLAKINELYPVDNATGFVEGDLRGLWKITFNN